MSNQLDFFPRYFTAKAIALYFILLVVLFMLFYNHSLPIFMVIIGVVEAAGFFYLSNLLTKRWSSISEKKFPKKLFALSLFIRVGWVIFSYIYYTIITGQPFEFDAGDTFFYNWNADRIHDGSIGIGYIRDQMGLDDCGYIYYLALIKTIIPGDIIITRLLKALLSAYTCILVYRIGQRNFGDKTARIAGIFCMLMPYLVYYCGLHAKETEMVFLVVLFIDRADFMFRSEKFNLATVGIPLLLAGVLFTFRTVLGMTALFSLLTVLLFPTRNPIKAWKRIFAGFWVVLIITYFISGRIASEITEVWQKKDENQSLSIQNKARINKFSDYASAAVFAPGILVIPLPTMVHVEGQENIEIINGGYYVKNILAFFIMLAFLRILKEKRIRDFTLLGSFTIGYLIIIAFSAFAQSGRFQMPVLPFLMLFGAFGVSKIKKSTTKYYFIYLIIIFVVIIAWNWFKLAGRDLI